MFKRHFLVLLLILVASLALLSAHTSSTLHSSQNQANNMPQYVFHVHGMIIWFPQCGWIQPYTGEVIITVTLTNGISFDIPIFIPNGANGQYYETIYLAGTPASVKITAAGRSVSKAYTAGHGGEIELSLTLGNPPPNPLIPTQPNQN